MASDLDPWQRHQKALAGAVTQKKRNSKKTLSLNAECSYPER
jgi:hypothetical protein